MTISIALAATLITLALVFYSIGVWAERLSKYLNGWHTISFWMGLIFDISGTWTMGRLSQGTYKTIDFHDITGQIALWLMLVHALWATYVVLRGSEISRKNFHKYSMIVWLIWLIPYLGGMYMGMSR